MTGSDRAQGETSRRDGAVRGPGESEQCARVPGVREALNGVPTEQASQRRRRCAGPGKGVGFGQVGGPGRGRDWGTSLCVPTSLRKLRLDVDLPTTCERSRAADRSEPPDSAILRPWDVRISKGRQDSPCVFPKLCPLPSFETLGSRNTAIILDIFITRPQRLDHAWPTVLCH